MKLITQNPAAIVKMPKLHEKNIVRLDVDEVAILLDEVESGEKLTEKTAGISRKDKGSGLGNLNFNAWYRYSCFLNVSDWIWMMWTLKTTGSRYTEKAARKSLSILARKSVRLF